MLVSEELSSLELSSGIDDIRLNRGGPAKIDHVTGRVCRFYDKSLTFSMGDLGLLSHYLVE